jgi:hypothetical protein
MPDFGVPKQELNGAKVGAGFQHVSGKRVPAMSSTT